MGFKTAGQTELLRSAQKDGFLETRIRLSVAEIAQKILGPRNWMKWKKELDVLSDFTYLALTTLSGFQTLGEEYVNVIQVDSSKRRVPSFLRRLVMTCLHVAGPYVLNYGLQWLEIKLPSHPVLRTFRPEVAAFLLDIIPTLRKTVSFVHRCHLASFYMQGAFYHLAKRFTGIRYVMLRKWLGDENQKIYFRILGLLTLTQLAAGIVMFVRSRNKSRVIENEALGKMAANELDDDAYVQPSLRCSLCLERRKNSTATPCGHLFCWTCVVEWIHSKPQCPLCREAVNPSRLVCLQNYDGS